MATAPRRRPTSVGSASRSPASILVDAGPLIAFFKRGDRHHVRVRRFLEPFRGRLLTTWPVLCEVTYMLGYSVERQTACLTWVRRGGATVVDIGVSDIETVIGLMTKYADHPMDLADASLVWLAQQTGVHDILTIDQRDFAAYRAFGRKPFVNLLA